MKLNNKGFAISTILYGMLTLTIIILMLVFAIMKSSRDMNKDFVDGIEENLNQCINEEIILENCYFNDSACDAGTYNSCIGKDSLSPLLADVAEVGDFVDYDAGRWNSTVAVPTDGNLYLFGGYKYNASRNGSVSCDNTINNSEYGWQILSIESGVVTLIHAGISECFKFANEAKALYVLTGSNPTNVSVTGLSPRSFVEYINSDFATSASVVVKNKLIGTNNNFPQEVDNMLFKANKKYILGDTYNNHLLFVENSLLNYAPITNVVYGIKPVIVLKNTVRTSGSIPNTGSNANSKTWILKK